jgi:predicted amidophosphoribosyltransferase
MPMPKLEKNYFCPKCEKGFSDRTPHPTIKFCGECGAEVITNCPKCKNPIRSPIDKFCTSCGTRYSTPQQ